MPKTNLTQEDKPDVSTKSVKIRPKRFATFLIRGVQLKFEPAKTVDGKLIRTPDGKKIMGKIVELRADMWKQDGEQALKEVLEKLINLDYVEIVR